MIQLRNKSGCTDIQLESTERLNCEATSLLKRIYFCIGASLSCFMMMALFYFWGVDSFYQSLFYLFGNVFLSCGYRYFELDESVDVKVQDSDSFGKFCSEFIYRMFLYVFLYLVVNCFLVVESMFLVANRAALSSLSLLIYPLLYNMAFLIFDVNLIVGALGFYGDSNKVTERFSTASLCCIVPTLALFLFQLYMDPVFLSFTVFVSLVIPVVDVILCLEFQSSVEKNRSKDMDVSEGSTGFDGQPLNSHDLKPGCSSEQDGCRRVRDRAHASKQDQTLWGNVRSFVFGR